MITAIIACFCTFLSSDGFLRRSHNTAKPFIPLKLFMKEYNIITNGDVKSIVFEVAGKPMSFETGKIGRQAGGSVVASTKDTMVYSTVCCERESKPVDFTPLRVDYFQRYSAVGQTIGAFHRRDSRGDNEEILVARLIDRPIRPMIAAGWQHETQVLTWLLSYDKTNRPVGLAISAASAAMCLSEAIAVLVSYFASPLWWSLLVVPGRPCDAAREGKTCHTTAFRSSLLGRL